MTTFGYGYLDLGGFAFEGFVISPKRLNEEGPVKEFCELGSLTHNKSISGALLNGLCEVLLVSWRHLSADQGAEPILKISLQGNLSYYKTSVINGGLSGLLALLLLFGAVIRFCDKEVAFYGHGSTYRLFIATVQLGFCRCENMATIDWELPFLGNL